MLTKNILLRSFKFKKNKKVVTDWNKIKKEYENNNNSVISSFSKKYKYHFDFKRIKKRYRNFNNVKIFGMGGSILGSEAIYSFLNHKIKKNFLFINNLRSEKEKFLNKNKTLNLIISKSGNTLETVANLNSEKKNKNNVFIVENNKSYLRDLAKKIGDEIIDHSNLIGGRYSVLSETGMLPAYLMGLNPDKFKQFDKLIKNKNFINQLILNASAIISLQKKKKHNSIILNYDENSNDLFFWYQQLVAESLGKKSKGVLPIISSVPKDNHSLMQLYLDGFKNNFFTFFYVKDTLSKKINNKYLFNSFKYLKNKKLEDVLSAQFIATQNVFNKKNIPFRTFIVNKKNEETLGELFIFFMLETILVGKAMGVNPYDQPAVELIKKETKKLLI
ncbi:glucose-6-phosphate isomerase [Candidatus Pelagibacter sp.]|uniref:glucose-6-phosphate isomerase n=1 Tax=Candidatus Pelagibacter sp. TaxID=2024849 RepID=UPI003F85963F